MVEVLPILITIVCSYGQPLIASSKLDLRMFHAHIYDPAFSARVQKLFRVFQRDGSNPLTFPFLLIVPQPLPLKSPPPLYSEVQITSIAETTHHQGEMKRRKLTFPLPTSPSANLNCSTLEFAVLKSNPSHSTRGVALPLLPPAGVLVPDPPYTDDGREPPRPRSRSHDALRD